MSNPVLVHALRGDVVENCHRGAIAVCDPRGRLIHAWGDVDQLVYPRSSIKALQALPLVESGAADHYSLSQAELALACSSHNAETIHTQAVKGLLARVGLEESALECGAHLPLHEPTAHHLLGERQQPGKIHNNCSGKHSGMLATACFLGEPTSGYVERDHPVQQRWFDVVSAMADVDMRALPWSQDGCGIPVIAMPLSAIATAFARFAAPDDLDNQRAEAIARIRCAIAANPMMVAGSGRLCSDIMQLSGQRLLVKSGADGVYTATLPESGYGLALKIDDGHSEASQVALLAALQHLGALRSDEIEALSERCQIPIHNTRSLVTGYRIPARDWAG